MRIRSYRETLPVRAIMIDGPLVVHKGDVVIVAVVEDWESAARLIATFDEAEHAKQD